MLKKRLVVELINIATCAEVELRVKYTATYAEEVDSYTAHLLEQLGRLGVKLRVQYHVLSIVHYHGNQTLQANVKWANSPVSGLHECCLEYLPNPIA